MNIGQNNTLTIVEKTASGYILQSPDSEQTTVLKNVKTEFNIGDAIDVFVYTYKNKQLHASIEEPFAKVNEFGFLQLLHQGVHGAFFDMGLDKDLLVPKGEQKYRMVPEEFYIIRVCLEEDTGRMFGTTKVDAHIQETVFDVEAKDTVKIMPVEITDLGYKCIINKKYLGMIYHNEIFQELECAETYEGVVKKIREDGLIDAALQVQGIQNLSQSKAKILAYLKDQGGSSPLTDKSSPEDIHAALSMSKKTFKNALGMLYREKKVVLSKEKTSLAPPKKHHRPYKKKTIS